MASWPHNKSENHKIKPRPLPNLRWMKKKEESWNSLLIEAGNLTLFHKKSSSSKSSKFFYLFKVHLIIFSLLLNLMALLTFRLLQWSMDWGAVYPSHKHDKWLFDSIRMLVNLMALNAIAVYSFPQETFYMNEYLSSFSLDIVSFHFLYLFPNWQLINMLCGNTWNPCSYQLQPSAKLAGWALDCKFSLTILYPNLLSPSLYLSYASIVATRTVWGSNDRFIGLSSVG